VRLFGLHQACGDLAMIPQQDARKALIERVSENCYQAAKAGIWCVDYVLGGSPEHSIAYDEHLVARARRAWHHGRLALEALTDALPPAPEVKDAPVIPADDWGWEDSTQPYPGDSKREPK
jgi:hypothetical protein